VCLDVVEDPVYACSDEHPVCSDCLIAHYEKATEDDDWNCPECREDTSSNDVKAIPWLWNKIRDSR
jgi:ubiquitin C-terminal hydrolase